jgi:signal peptidase I
MRRVTTLATALVLLTVVTVMAGLFAGYRPVVLQTGSMGDTAPPGSLVVASPKSADSIVVGDIIVMQRAGATPVTHRVVEIAETDVGRVATTKGDANEFADPAPFPLRDDQLVARWIVPEAGAAIESIRTPQFLLLLLAVATAATVAWTLRRIWRNDPALDATAAGGPPTDATSVGRGWPQRGHVGFAIALVAVLACAGVVLSLYTSAAQVPTNQFGASDCFAPSVTAVQNGETVHATDGVVSVSIGSVDPNRAFVTASVRSSANEIADSNVQVRLLDSTTIEIERATDAGSPPAVTVAWSVVEYGCGITVQRGVATGTGTNAIDVPIATIDSASSFALISMLAPGSGDQFGPDDLAVAEFPASDSLRIRGAATAVFGADRSVAWQVVSFEDPDVIDVSRVNGTLTAGSTSTSLTLPTAVDPGATFLITAITSDAAGIDIGERSIRAVLVDDSTIGVERSIGGDAVDVSVQVVTLLDGTTVQYGTVDLDAATASRTVAIDPIDPTRSSVFSTVAVPGPAAGGLSDHVTDDVIGEATATFVFADPSTVAITRDATASNSSFAWQVVEWSGPGWWDTDYMLRRRIDVTTSTATAPGGYTVPVVVDHADLVASGLSEVSGDDLRVLRWDGSTWLELDRILDDGSSWNAVDTTFLFRTNDPIAATSTSTYWLYFSNTAAGTPPADPEFVYTLVEGFEAGDLGDFEDRTGGTGWYRAEPWSHRLALTVASGTVAADLTDFPLLVSITDTDIAANAQLDGSDLRFTAADGTTPLAYELEDSDIASGAVTAWVTVPVLSASSDTTIYLYFGAADSPAQDDIDGVWGPEFEAVWHLDRDPSGAAPQLDDATTINHDGLSAGSMTPADLVAGHTGGAIDFDGGDDALVADRLDMSPFGEMTVSAWVRLDANGVDTKILSHADAGSRGLELDVDAAGAATVHLGLSGGEATATTPAAAVSIGTWHHVAARWDGVDLEIVVDGVTEASVPASGVIAPRPQLPVVIGNSAALDRGVDGVIDEVRVERTARSDAWLAAVVANQATPATFVSVAPVETGTWFDQGTWANRKPIVLDAAQVDADINDYVLFVDLIDARLQSAAQADADDIVFTGADGTTRLDHVVETYDPGTGTLRAWVRVPVVSSSVDTELFIYYGNPTATDQNDPVAVFGSNADGQILGAP